MRFLTCQNSFSFVLITIMSFSIMFWNVQGAASKDFRLAFKTLIKSFNTAMVVLLEPRISGSNTDAFIKNYWFEHSHRWKQRDLLVGFGYFGTVHMK